MRRRKCPPTSAGGMGPRRSARGSPESYMAEGSRLGPKAGSTSRVRTPSAARARYQNGDVPRTAQWRVNVAVIDRQRVLHGWTQSDLARAAHVDSKTIRDMVAGRRRPSFGTIQALCVALDIALSSVIVFVEDGLPPQ